MADKFINAKTLESKMFDIPASHVRYNGQLRGFKSVDLTIMLSLTEVPIDKDKKTYSINLGSLPLNNFDELNQARKTYETISSRIVDGNYILEVLPRFGISYSE